MFQVVKLKGIARILLKLEWNPMDILQLQQVDNKFTRTVDFWLDNIVAGFITKFAVVLQHNRARVYEETSR
jgi:hypothetical protein